MWQDRFLGLEADHWVEMLHETGSCRTSFERSGSERVESPRSGKQAVGLILTMCNADSACAQYSKRMAMLQVVTLAAPLGESQSVVRSVYTRRDEGNWYYITGCSPHVTLLGTSGTKPEQWRTRQCACMHEVRLIPLLACVPPFPVCTSFLANVVIQSIPSRIWQKP